jgi:hypothetical protein
VLKQERQEINNSKRCSGTSSLVYPSILFLNTEKIILYFMYLLRSDGPVAAQCDAARSQLDLSEENSSALSVGLTPACSSDQATITGRTYEHRHCWYQAQPEQRSEPRMVSIVILHFSILPR